MRNTLSRREFMKIGGAAAGALALQHFISPEIAASARAAGTLDGQGNGYIPTMCEMCVFRCGVLAKVKDGRVVKLEGNPMHPHSLGRLCARGQSGLMNTYDPNRIQTPLIRVGKRGEGKFRKASWDEALDLVAQNMLTIKERFGPEAMIFSSTHNLSQVQFENLLNAFGSPNYGTQRSLCFNAMIVANQLTFGMEEPERSYDDLKYILLTGRNLMEAISTSETSALSHAVDRGVKTVYLDPRFTKTAAKADLWLPIRPGTDLAFHLALIHVILLEGLYHADFVQKYTIGIEELKGSIAQYTPEWAAPITEIPAETIRQIAHDFAAAGPHALAHNGWRTSNFVNSFQTERAIAILNSLVGNWNVALFASGGENSTALGAPSQPAYPRISATRLDGVPWKYPMVPLKLGVFQELRDAVISGKPYPAYGWFVSRQNPVQSIPDRTRTLEAMGKLNFITVVDIFLNDTAWFADVVLPEASYLERYDPLLPIGSRAYLRQPVIEPLGESKSALWIYKQLGERLGLADFFQYANEEDYIQQQLAPLGITLDEVRQQGFADLPGEKDEFAFKWNTPSGKIELASETLRNSGFAPSPVWEEPPVPAEQEFYLLTGKVGQHTQFATQNNLLLHKYEDEPCLWMNSESANGLGLSDEDLVEVTSEVGTVNVKLRVTTGIRPDCVFMTPGYGHLSQGLATAYGNGASDSVLHVTYTDPISGSQALSQTFVTIKKIIGL